MPPLRPPFAEFPVLTTPRLRLRMLTAADVPQILPISFFRGQLAKSLAEAHQMQLLIRDEYEKGTSVPWGFARADDETTVVGTGGFFRGFPDDVGEIGYVLLPAFRGQGYATEAVVVMARFGFEVLGLRQVQAFTDPANAASGAVLHRAGFREVPGDNPAKDRRFVLDPAGR